MAPQKKALHKALTDYWVHIQGGSDYDTSKYIWEVFQLLELDRKAIRDLMLLAHCGVVGRTAFNEVMWALLSEHGLQSEYKDLSRKGVLHGSMETKSLRQTSCELERQAHLGLGVPQGS